MQIRKIWRIARNEARRLRSSPATWIVAGALILAIIYALIGGLNFAKAQRSAASDVQSEQQETYERELALLEGRVADATEDEIAAARSTRGSAHVMALPPAPLAALAIGQSDLLPSAYGVSIYNKQRTREDRYGYENPQSLLAGRFDLALVLVLILPLLIIAFSFDVLSRERESGTLSMLLVTPVMPREIVLGKLIPRAVLFLGLVALASLAGGLISGSGSLPFAELLLWTLLVVAYGLFWFAAVAWISLLGRGSSFNALALTLIWLTLIFILPAVAHLLGAKQAPVDPRIEAVMAARSTTDNFFSARPRLVKLWYEVYPDLLTPERSPETVGRSFTSGFFLNQWDMDHRSKPVEVAIDQQLRQQQGWIDRLSFLSPAMLLREGLNELAGSDLRRHLAFRTQAEAYREEWRRFFGPLFIHDLELEAETYAAMPIFQFVEEPWSDRAKRQGWRLVALLFWIVVLGGFFFLSPRQIYHRAQS